MRRSWFACVTTLAALAGGCGDNADGDSDAGRPIDAADRVGLLLDGELTGRLGGEPFPVRYGHLWDWDDDWGARIGFVDGPVTCAGEYPDPENLPQFSAWLEMDEDPVSDQDWNGAHIIMQNFPRVVREFDLGQLHLERVDQDSVSGTIEWGDDSFSLEGAFEIERCYREYPGD